MIEVEREGTTDKREIKPPRTREQVLSFLKKDAKWGEGEIAELLNGHRISCLEGDELQAGLYVFSTPEGVEDDASPSLRAEVQALNFKMMELQIQNNRRNQTTWGETDIGKLYYDQASRVTEISCLATVSGKVLKQAVKAVLKKFPHAKATGKICRKVTKTRGNLGGEGGADEPSTSLSGLKGTSLADLIPEAGTSALNEESHMQPALFEVVTAMAEAVGSELVVLNTHKSNPLQNPLAKPDILLSASALVAWTQAVSFLKFKLFESDVFNSFGQQITRVRNALEHQPDRSHVVTVGITMNQLEVACFSQTPLAGLSVVRTGPQPFSVSEESVGFQLLLRLLASSKVSLGFKIHALPTVERLGEHRIEELRILRQGTAPNGRGSFVFEARVAEKGRCILKLNHSELEGDLLEALTTQKVQRVVGLLAKGEITYQGAKWQGVLIHPYADPVTANIGLETLAQVTFDIALAIRGCISVKILHRDVTPNNIGVHNGRGVLFDFSAGKQLPADQNPEDQLPSPTGAVQHITGTPLYAPLSVLLGKPHTESSMLEGLFLSVLDRCCDGKLRDRHDMVLDDLPGSQRARRGSMSAPRLEEVDNISSHLRSFVQSLHAVFFPLSESREIRGYRTNVSMEEIREVCQRFHPRLLT